MNSLRLFAFSLLILFVSACGAAARQVIPTERPTPTITLTPSISPTPGLESTPTPRPAVQNSGPTPTSIFGATTVAVAVLPSATRVPNPNAPRIEFFTTDVASAAPGDIVTLFWSIQNARGAVIYRMDNGVRGNLWNVPPDGKLPIPTRRRDRVEVTFLLVAGEGDLETDQTLTIPLSCPDAWFFQPAPDACPSGPSQATSLIEEPFERGRMIYVQTRNRVYALFNDGRAPAWVSFENQFNPAKDPETEESFVPPPGFVQPLRILGFVWRGSDVVRNRLGLGTAAEIGYEGFVQTVTDPDGTENLYANSSDGTVLQLLPGGDSWQIVKPP